MATFVLVAGNWLGGWAWEQVSVRLTAAGHTTHPVTLTGLGDRVHLAGPHITLDTHVDDIVNAISYGGLHDVVLVGHSYGGFPVTAAADRIPSRIAKVVYVESGPLPGLSQLDTEGPDAREAALARMKDDPVDGWRGPLPSWAALGEEVLAGLDEAARARFAERAVDQPLAANAQPLTLTNESALNAIPHALVTCMFPQAQVQAMIADGHPYFAGFSGKQWEFAEVPTGHWPMFSEPAKLAEALAGLA